MSLLLGHIDMYIAKIMQMFAQKFDVWNFLIELGFTDYELTKERTKFRKQTVAKIASIKNLCKYKLT